MNNVISDAEFSIHRYRHIDNYHITKLILNNQILWPVGNLEQLLVEIKLNKKIAILMLEKKNLIDDINDSKFNEIPKSITKYTSKLLKERTTRWRHYRDKIIEGVSPIRMIFIAFCSIKTKCITDSSKMHDFSYYMNNQIHK